MDPAKLKVVELRSELGSLGLDTKGNKAALVERLKKALESKTGKSIPDTTILDTSTEDADEPSTPRRPGPASRTTRRSSSSYMSVASTPSKVCLSAENADSLEIADESSSPKKSVPASRSTRRSSSSYLTSTSTPSKLPKMVEEPEISEEEESRDVPDTMDDDSSDPTTEVREQEPSEPEPEERTPSSDEAQEQADEPMETNQNEPQPSKDVRNWDELPIEDSDSQNDEHMTDHHQDQQQDQSNENKKHDEDEKKTEVNISDNGDNKENDEMNENKDENKAEGESPAKSEPKLGRIPRRMNEEEEWAELNKRIQMKEQERLERELKQNEDDAKKLEEARDDPVKLNRLMKKKAKKSRWNNFYRTIENTNAVLNIDGNISQYTTLPTSVPIKGKDDKSKKEPVLEDPLIDESQVTLSWYDSDLQLQIDRDGFYRATPMTDGVFAHAWCGARASHGVQGRVKCCYEVKVGPIVMSTEEGVTNGLRVGWSTVDSSLHLGDSELSWGYENTGEVCNNGEFEKFGKTYQENDVIGVYLDMMSYPATISFTLNGEDLGKAFEFDPSVLQDKALFPHILTKNTCYKVNFGYEKFNYITKTKTVRTKIDVPIDQVLEEKKVLEAEIQKAKEEYELREKARMERIKKEREERKKKKKELKEKKDQERKEKEKKEQEEREANKMEEDTPTTTIKEETEIKVKEEEKPTAETDEKKEDSDSEKEEEEATPPPPEPKSLLDPKVKYVSRFVVDQVLDGEVREMLPGYVFIALLPNLVAGPTIPTPSDVCEVILMVGLPGAGKTHWVNNYVTQNPDRRFNVISMGTLFSQMRVKCKPFRASYEGKWDTMISKCAKGVLKLLEIAQTKRRNYILDQTNVYPTAQRRKLRDFERYKRSAVVVVPDAETYAQRRSAKDENDGKEVPDGAILEMKANFALPTRCGWLDTVTFTDLGEEEAKKAIEEYHQEAKAAGVGKEKEKDNKREHSGSRDLPAKRPRMDDRRPPREDRRPPRDRGGYGSDQGNRWGGGGGGGGSGGGSRWGQPRRDNASRWGGGGGGGGYGHHGGGGYGGGGGGGYGGGGGGGYGGGGGGGGGRDRWSRGGGGGGGGGYNDDFGGGRDRGRGPRGPGGPMGGHGGPGGPGGPGGHGGPGGPGGRRGPDRRPPQGNAGTGSWQRGGQMQQGNNQNNQQMPPRNNQMANRNQKNDQNSNQNNGNNPQQNWGNQWGNWGQWGNWNPAQAAGWGAWNNWANWGQQNAGAGGAAGAGGGAGGAGSAGAATTGTNANTSATANNANTAAVGNKSKNASSTTTAATNQTANASGDWSANYQQQWYQWQQWQQQQQQWQQYNQNNQSAATPAEQQQMWAQYYQNYGNAANTAAASQTTEKK